MFVTAPASIEIIAIAGLPSARMTEVVIFISIKTGKNAKMTSRYSTAMSMVFSDAPKSISAGRLSG